MIDCVSVYSFNEARLLSGNNSQALISISNDYEYSCLKKWDTLLRLDFLDADLAEDIRYYGSFRKANNVMPGCFGPKHRKQLERFLKKLEKKCDISELIIHCHAGESRSVAVAKYVCERYGIGLNFNESKMNVYVFSWLKGGFDEYQ